MIPSLLGVVAFQWITQEYVLDGLFKVPKYTTLNMRTKHSYRKLVTFISYLSTPDIIQNIVG